MSERSFVIIHQIHIRFIGPILPPSLPIPISNPDSLAAFAFPIPARSFPSLTQLLSLPSPNVRKEGRKEGTEGRKDEKSKREKRGRKRESGKSEYAAETKIRTRGRSTHRASERASKGGRGGGRVGRVLNGGGTIKALFHGQRERESRE